jgi:hypothetical protein
MPIDPQTGLPFARDSHESHRAAVKASATRATKTRAYLKLLYARGPLTDHEAAAAMALPLSSINSIRNGVVTSGLVEKTEIVRTSSYGQPCRCWYLSAAGSKAVAAMSEAA